MRYNLKSIFRRRITVLTVLVFLLTCMTACAQENMDNENGFEKDVTVAGRQMRVVLYGNITRSQEEDFFTDNSKSTLVMLPGLGVASPPAECGQHEQWPEFCAGLSR